MPLKIPKFAFLSILLLSASLAHAIPSGKWEGAGTEISNGAKQNSKIYLTIQDGRFVVDTHVGGFVRTQVYILKEGADGHVDWLDHQQSKIGTGFCQALSCTLQAMVMINQEPVHFFESYQFENEKLFIHASAQTKDVSNFSEATLTKVSGK